LRMSGPNLFGQANKQKNRRATEGCHARGLSKFNTGGKAVADRQSWQSKTHPPPTNDKIIPDNKFYRI